MNLVEQLRLTSTEKAVLGNTETVVYRICVRWRWGWKQVKRYGHVAMENGGGTRPAPTAEVVEAEKRGTVACETMKLSNK